MGAPNVLRRPVQAVHMSGTLLVKRLIDLKTAEQFKGKLKTNT